MIRPGSGGLDYAEIDGMCTVLDGLAKWVGLSAVETSLLLDTEAHNIIGVNLEAKNRPQLDMGEILI